LARADPLLRSAHQIKQRKTFVTSRFRSVNIGYKHHPMKQQQHEPRVRVCVGALALVVSSFAVSTPSVAKEEDTPVKPQAIVTIDTAAPSKTYSPMIFGGFLEHFDHQIYGGVFDPGSPLSDKRGFRRDVVAALKELRCPIVRWPGGCYASGYHWETGVGKQRRPTDDMAWGVVEPNTFGTDEFVELCRLTGWQPYICNNAGNGTIEEMKNWVEYCNASKGTYAQMRKDNGYAKPQNVNLWSIGNENWGAHEIGYKPIEQWAPLVLAAAKAMKAADPHIQLTAAALPTREWTLPLLKMAGQYLDYISIHNYWLPLWGKNDMPDYLTCIMHSESPEQMIANYIGVLQESGYRGRIKIAFDEWNLRGWHHEGFPRKEVQDYTNPEVIRLVAAREKNHIASQYTMSSSRGGCRHGEYRPAREYAGPALRSFAGNRQAHPFPYPGDVCQRAGKPGRQTGNQSGPTGAKCEIGASGRCHRHRERVGQTLGDSVGEPSPRKTSGLHRQDERQAA
jgi:hypothetical protein